VAVAATDLAEQGKRRWRCTSTGSAAKERSRQWWHCASMGLVAEASDSGPSSARVAMAGRGRSSVHAAAQARGMTSEGARRGNTAWGS